MTHSSPTPEPFGAMPPLQCEEVAARLSSYAADTLPEHMARALEWHAALIKRLSDEYPDGWALSLHTPSLRELLPLCPPDVRVGAWCKSFCSFKPNVNPAYAWEPVIWRGGRKRQRWDDKVRDYAVIPITLKQGFPGAKPAKFMRWVLELLNAEKTDTIDDLFPGSGACSRAVEAWKTERTLWEQNSRLCDTGNKE